MVNRQDLRPIPLVFWRSATGREPVRDWLRGLPPDMRLAIGNDLRRLQFGWPIGMPLCRQLKERLWEVRTDLPRGQIARTLFCIVEGEIYVLNGFLKKTQKTPEKELSLALKRMKEIDR